MAVAGYAAATSGCRRAALAAHFSEPLPPCNGMCDLCAANAAAMADGGGASRTTAQQQQQQQQRDITAEALCAIASLRVSCRSLLYRQQPQAH
jgi:superfamily II DNA helicase RecQ